MAPALRMTRSIKEKLNSFFAFLFKVTGSILRASNKSFSFSEWYPKIGLNHLLRGWCSTPWTILAGDSTAESYVTWDILSY